jgi:hypothetical protein
LFPTSDNKSLNDLTERILADLYIRQLHPDEKTLAKQLADKSDGRYTQAKIEDQMRIMGVSAYGQHESGAPETLIGQAPTDAGAKWISAGTSADGKPILTQVTAQADPELQKYILANNHSATPGQVPSLFNYDRADSERARRDEQLGEDTGSGDSGDDLQHGDTAIYSTGIRRAELTTLHAHDVDHDRGTMMIREGKGKRDRLIPIGDRASDDTAFAGYPADRSPAAAGVG